MKIMDRLTGSAVRAVPMSDGFAVNTTTADGRGYALLNCAVCSWYGYYISGHGGGRTGDLFQSADLALLNLQAAGHACPPEVRKAAQLARSAREGIAASHAEG